MSDLKKAAQQALEALESLFSGQVDPERGQRCGNAVLALRAALEQQEQEPVACFIGIKGSAYDLPTTKRAYTYADQPGNVDASKLGRAIETAKHCSAGDSIDAGLVLLKALQAEGFGVFQLGAEYTHPPRRETEQEPVALFTKYGPPTMRDRDFWSAGYAAGAARAIEAALKERNT
jgi:hypothetical protein